MSSTPPPQQQSGFFGSVKGFLGIGGQATAPAPTPPTSSSQPQAPMPRQSSGPAPIKTTGPLGRHDSMPELVGTPSDIGVWEVSHEMRDGGKFSWRRLFQDPSTYRTDGGPSPKKTASK